MKTGSFLYARKRNSAWHARLFILADELGYNENEERFIVNNG